MPDDDESQQGLPKRICVIGAGSSGLAAIKSAKEEGLEVVCFEKSNFIGGVWRFDATDEEGRPSVMRSTVINTSKEMSAFSDFPPPAHFANFMHNSYMLEYFTLYTERFDLLKHIKFKHDVVNVEMAEDYEESGRWQVTSRNLDKNSQMTEVFEGVMVCTGHHVYPHVPDFKGFSEFKGKSIHTHSLKSSSGFEDKTVLVVGVGNSGVDAAVEISKVSKQVYLSSRRGSWIFSRVGPIGEPYDIFLQKRFYMTVLRPIDYFNVLNGILHSILNYNFDHAKYGLKPKHGALNAHITINDALPNCILSGIVTVKQIVEQFTEEGIIFEGEDQVTKIDAVVFATGYEMKFPFISEKVIQVKENCVNLHKLVFPAHLPHPTLAFIALVQPLGAMFPIAEAQSRWFVQLLLGRVHLPSQNDMEKEVSERRKTMSRRYVTSPRHTVQVDWIVYMDEICKEFGAKPNLLKMAFSDPVLFYRCMWGPCVPYQYRLQGPHPWEGARKAITSARQRIDAPFKTCPRAGLGHVV